MTSPDDLDAHTSRHGPALDLAGIKASLQTYYLVYALARQRQTRPPDLEEHIGVNDVRALVSEVERLRREIKAYKHHFGDINDVPTDMEVTPID